MDLETIRKLTEDGEKDYLEVPQGSMDSGKTFDLEDVKECFSKAFAIRELIYLVGSTATHPEGKAHDVDIVIPMDDLPEDLQTAIKFRLYRAFSGHFDIPYDDTAKYLHIHNKGPGQSPYTAWVSLYKLGLMPSPSEERSIHQMSLEESNERVIGGVVSTDSIDLEGERITQSALEKIWAHIQSLPSEYLNLMLGHSSTQLGTIELEYKDHKSGLRNDGLYLIAKLRTDLDEANKVWSEILSGELHSFSIKIEIPKPVSANTRKVCIEEKCWYELLDGAFIEASLTKNPANEECSQLDILSGS